MRHQFYGKCRECGRMVLFTRSRTGKCWWPCNPYIRRFHLNAERGVTFISPDGERHQGIPENLTGGGVLGYLRHDCGGDA